MDAVLEDRPRQDSWIIGLISAGHFLSHSVFSELVVGILCQVVFNCRLQSVLI